VRDLGYKEGKGLMGQWSGPLKWTRDLNQMGCSKLAQSDFELQNGPFAFLCFLFLFFDFKIRLIKILNYPKV